MCFTEFPLFPYESLVMRMIPKKEFGTSPYLMLILGGFLSHHSFRVCNILNLLINSSKMTMSCISTSLVANPSLLDGSLT